MLHLSLRVKRLYQNLNDKEQDLDRLRYCIPNDWSHVSCMLQGTA